MATKTTNYNLTKPAYDEDADIKVINDNMDIIDTKMKEIEDAGGGAQITVDAELSETSTNPVQNKVISSKINELNSNLSKNVWNGQFNSYEGSIFCDLTNANQISMNINGFECNGIRNNSPLEVGNTLIVGIGLAYTGSDRNFIPCYYEVICDVYDDHIYIHSLKSLSITDSEVYSQPILFAISKKTTIFS